MAAQKKTLYDILGLQPDAMSIDVGLAYRNRLAELQRAAAQDPNTLALLHEAHEVLSNPKRRAAYDAQLLSDAEKAAAKEQAHAPDLVLEEAQEEAPRRRIPPVGIGVGIVVVLILLFFALRPSTPEAPKAVVEQPVEAPKPPAPPPPPQPKSAREILALAQDSVGRLQSFEMSGRAVPVGLAFATEAGAMVTTCHGMPAGAQLVVSVGAENHSATLAVTDEVLDLCRLSVAPPPLKPLAVARDELKAGDTIYVLGASAAGALALTQGKVKRLIPDARGRLIELSMPVAPNGSGGPVFDSYGQLAGIATTSQGHGAGVSVALPAAWLGQMRSRERGP